MLVGITDSHENFVFGGIDLLLGFLVKAGTIFLCDEDSDALEVGGQVNNGSGLVVVHFHRFHIQLSEHAHQFGADVDHGEAVVVKVLLKVLVNGIGIGGLR